MRRLLLLLMLPSVLFAQTYFNVDFTGGFPPSGWTISAQSANWSAVTSNYSGGAAPEARFSWSPQFTGESRLISPSINLSGVSALKLQFKYSLDHYGGNYTIGIATRSGSGAWNVVWSKVNPTASVPGTTETVTINNSDLGSSDFQLCFYFTGNSYNINYWYLDDLKLFTPLALDAKLKDILVGDQYVPGTTLGPQAIVTNFGTSVVTFTTTCTIKQNGVVTYTNESTPVTLNPDEDQTITFPDITLSAPNEIFEITATTNLTGDMDPTNDTYSKEFNTYTTEKNIVILEIGTGTWCVYCPGASMGAHDLIANGQKVGVVKYHNGDPFTNSYSNARNTYYGITGFPTAVFDGVIKFVGGSNTQSMYSNYLPIYNSRKVKNSPFQVEIFGSNSNLDYNITVRVTKVANISPSMTNLVLHFALTESNIPFSWQGQTQVDYAERLMAPNESGTPLNFASGNEYYVDLAFSIDQTWVLNNLELVAFVQNTDNKEILQGSKLMITELTPVPVELSSFTATSATGGIVLEWVTASEINNLGFEIERSFDGTIFNTIGFVEGNGTTTEKKTYLFFDKSEVSGEQKLYYRLKQVDYNGNFTYTDVIETSNNLPVDYVLQQNYPNPFNPSTTIKFSIPIDEYVSLRIYDMLGNEIADIISEKKTAGNYEIRFDATDLASGVYIYKLTAGQFFSVKKMTLIK